MLFDGQGYGIACQHLVAKKKKIKRYFRLLLTRRGRSYSGKNSREDERISKCADNAALFAFFGSWMKGSKIRGNVIPYISHISDSLDILAHMHWSKDANQLGK